MSEPSALGRSPGVLPLWHKVLGPWPFGLEYGIRNHIALVTGAASGMRLVTAKAFAEASAAVVLAELQGGRGEGGSPEGTCCMSRIDL
jgi:hypothetical protein